VLEAIPGVKSAAFVTKVPMDRGLSAIAAVEGHDYGTGLPPTRTIKLMSPGLLHTLGTPLLAGRDVTWEELYEQRNVALVSESFARAGASVAGASGTDSPPATRWSTSAFSP